MLVEEQHDKAKVLIAASRCLRIAQGSSGWSQVKKMHIYGQATRLNYPTTHCES
jgi:hypothetical protein